MHLGSARVSLLEQLRLVEVEMLAINRVLYPVPHERSSRLRRRVEVTGHTSAKSLSITASWGALTTATLPVKHSSTLGFLGCVSVILSEGHREGARQQNIAPGDHHRKS